MSVMKVLCKKYSQKGLWLEEKKRPEIKAHEVLVKVKKTAICGTDLHIYNWDEWSQENIKVPIVLGHEFVGRVEAIGSDVTLASEGDRVSAEGHLVCGICRNCRAGKRHFCRQTTGIGIHTDGAFAEYVKVPESNLYKIPESISDEEAAVFDPFGNAVFSTSVVDVSGEDILITGAGPVGAMTALICQHLGARHIVISDINDYRLSLVKDEPRIHTVNISKESLKSTFSILGLKEGFDVLFEMSGNNKALNDLIDFSRHGAHIVNLGIFSEKTEVDFNKIIFKSLNLRGIYGREMFDSWYKMVSFIESGLNLKKLITHGYSFDQYEEAFDLLNNGRACKVILDWSCIR